jgi:broad specificity phosphatase PhoE
MYALHPIIIFVRHAESEFNRMLTKCTDHTALSLSVAADTALTELGHEQAAKTAEHLVQRFQIYGPNAKLTVWISPFNRTIQTATHFLHAAGDMITKVEIIPELQEYTPPQKILPLELQEQGMINHTDWNHFTDNLIELTQRLRTAYRELKSNEHLVIFSHSLVISTLLSYYAGQEQTMIGDPAINIPNCGISCVRPREPGEIGVWDLYTIANIAHLPPEIVTGTHVPFH